MYNEDNIFKKIIDKKVKADIIFENDNAMSFRDIEPCAETHVLIIPKGNYENILMFTKNANDKEKNDFWDCFLKTTEILGIKNDFNFTANAGKNAPFVAQSVFHFHVHLLAGKKINTLKA